MAAPSRWAAPPRPAWEDEPSKAGLAGKGIVLVGACLGVLFPLWIVVVTSLSTKQTITEAGGLVMIPKGITFIAYQELLSGGQVTRASAGS